MSAAEECIVVSVSVEVGKGQRSALSRFHCGMLGSVMNGPKPITEAGENSGIPHQNSCLRTVIWGEADQVTESIGIQVTRSQSRDAYVGTILTNEDRSVERTT
jgi:hypothetical protein